MLYFTSCSVATCFGNGRPAGPLPSFRGSAEVSADQWVRGSMRRILIFTVAGLSLVAVEAINLRADRAPEQATRPAPAAPSSAAQAPAPAPSRAVAAAATPAIDANAVVQKYCASCHNDRMKSGNVVLQNLNPDQTAATHTDIWEKVVLKLRGGMMPPQSAPRPDEATLNALTVHLEHTLDRLALSAPDPGHKPVHRLNRTEYGNAVRDLLDLQIDPSQLLPADDES